MYKIIAVLVLNRYRFLCLWSGLIRKVSVYKSTTILILDGKASIEIREDIVLPLLTIQQYALKKIQEILASKKASNKELEVYQKMVTRSLFGNINASRNSA